MALMCGFPALAQDRYDQPAQAARLLQWWPGQYDNHEQITRQSGGGLSALTDTPFFRVHSIVRRLDPGADGKPLISVRTYRNGEPTRLVKDELYAVAMDPKLHLLRLERFGRRTVPAVAADLNATPRATDYRPLGPQCDILLNFVGSQFEGGEAPRACAEGADYADDRMAVGANFYWTRERRRDLRTDAVTRQSAPGAAYGWFEQSRALPYTCVVMNNAEGDMKKTAFFKTIRIDDQGGEADLKWPDGRTLTFSIQNRAFTDPPDREYPLFGVHEKGNPVPIAYAYAVDGSRRFGLNLGWFYVRCYAEGEVNASEIHLSDPSN